MDMYLTTYYAYRHVVNSLYVNLESNNTRCRIPWTWKYWCYIKFGDLAIGAEIAKLNDFSRYRNTLGLRRIGKNRQI